MIQVAPGANFSGEVQGSLAFVDEIKEWGVQAAIVVPQGLYTVVGEDGAHRAYLRLSWDEFVRIGPAGWPPIEEAAETG